MTLKPFTCIHCQSETRNFAMIHFIYDQNMYEHMYGVNHPKGTREVDAGNVPVFVCDDCVREMNLFGKHYIVRIALSVLLALICIFALRFNGGLALCAAPFIGVIFLMGKTQGEYMERSKHQHRNNVASYGWTKQDAINMDQMSSISGFSLIMAAIVVVVFVVSIFVKGLLLKILAILLLIISIITIVGSLIGYLAANSKPQLDDYEKAARHYIYFDENILLKDRW